MNIEIIERPLRLEIFGFSGTAVGKDYAGTAFGLSGKMWKAVKSHNLKNKGLNICVYESNEKVFAGVELDEMPEPETRLEHKIIELAKYAYFKHIGPYNLIKQAGQNMTSELTPKGFQAGLPAIEIYGYWTPDESKLETELLFCIRKLPSLNDVKAQLI